MKVERVDWETYHRWLKRRAKTGQHGVIIGMNGSGKTLLAREIVPMFGASGVVFDTKGGDDPSLNWEGWVRERSWPPTEEHHVRRFDPKHRNDPIHVHLAPKMPWENREKMAGSVATIKKALMDLMGRRGRTKLDVIFFDETSTIARWMGFKDDLAVMLQTLRYRPVSVISSLQWPTWLPKEAYRETTHRWVFGVPGEEDRKFVAMNVLAGDRKEIMDVLTHLRRFEFCHQDIRSPDRLVISKVQLTP